MIHTASIVLVIDANILLSIVKKHGSGSLVAALRAWATSIIQRIDPKPRGKTIAVLVTTSILRDYWTGLSHGGYRINQGTKKEFRMYAGKSTTIDNESGIKFSVMVVQEKKHVEKIDVGDRYDRPYPKLLLTIASEKRWLDRHVIFASNDAKLLGGVRDTVVRKLSSKRFCLAANMSEFEDAIMH